MATLSKYWITEPHLDFEYKKYTLLAWWKKVEYAFLKQRLYPYFQTINEQVNALEQWDKSRIDLHSGFPKDLVGFDLMQQKIHYKNTLQDSKVMEELKAIIGYALPQFKFLLEEGKAVKSAIEQQLHIAPVGVSPLYQKEGYVLVGRPKRTLVFLYCLKKVKALRQAEYQTLVFQRLPGFKSSFATTPERLKRELILRYPSKPNPAVFYVDCDARIPIQQTVLPLTRKNLYTRIVA